MACRIFISHVWRAHKDDYLRLLTLLSRAPRFKINDLSVPVLRALDARDYADARNEILAILETADVVLTINTPVTGLSAAVRDELARAEELEIPIVAISPPSRHGRTRGTTFDVVQRAYQARWRTQDIVETIRRAIRERPRVSRPHLSEPFVDPADLRVKLAENEPSAGVQHGLTTDFGTILLRRGTNAMREAQARGAS